MYYPALELCFLKSAEKLFQSTVRGLLFYAGCNARAFGSA